MVMLGLVQYFSGMSKLAKDSPEVVLPVTHNLVACPGVPLISRK